MKKVLLIAIMGLSCTSYAWVSTTPQQKEYSFKYNLKGNSLEVKKSGLSYEEAFEFAAQQCFNHYKGSGKLSEERGLDIIDVCANPRS